jgi:hypothetical protein
MRRATKNPLITVVTNSITPRRHIVATSPPRCHHDVTTASPPRIQNAVASASPATGTSYIHQKQETAMLPSLIRKTSCAATLCFVGLLAFDASAADVQLKGNHLKIKFDKHASETISILGEPGLIGVFADGEMVALHTGIEHISVKGSPSDDTLEIDQSVVISGHLNIKTGAGDDDISLSGVFMKNVKVNMGTGNDLLDQAEDWLFVGGSFTIKAGAGEDQVDFHQAMLVQGSMSIDLGKGLPDNEDLHLKVGPYQIDKTLSVRLSKKGEEDVVFRDVATTKLIIRGGQGHNTVDLQSGDNAFGEATYKKIDEFIHPA